MKISTMAVILLLFTACSQKNEQQPNSPESSVIELEAKSGVVTGSGDFGTLNPSDVSKMLTFKITNNGTEPLVGPATVDNVNFSIAYQNCASVKVKSSCTIKVSFDPKSKSGPYSANLMLDSVFASLSASVNVPVVTPSVNFLIGGSSVSSTDFGILNKKQVVTKSISIKNMGSSSLTDTVVVPSGFSLSYDSCSGKAIAKGSSCAIKVTLSGDTNSGEVSGNLTYGGSNLLLSGQILSSLSNIVFLNGLGEINSHNFGIISGSGNVQLILNIKNIGSGIAPAASATLGSSDFSIIYNQCNNVSLPPGASCQVRILFSGIGKNSQVYNSTLSFGDKTLPLSVEYINKKQIIFSSLNNKGLIVAKIKNTEDVVLSGDMISADKIVVLTSSSLNTDFSFIKWTGSCSGQGSVCELSMNQDQNTQVQYLKPLSKVLGTNGITSAQTLTHWFGDLNALKFEDYDTSSWTGNVTFLPRSVAVNPPSAGVAQASELTQPTIHFVNLESVAPQNCVSPVYADCNVNMNKWLEKITSITLPDSGNLPILLTSNMKIGTRPVVNVLSGPGPSRMILDLFDDNSRFAYDAGGSPLRLNPAFLGQYNTNNLDALEFRRPIQPETEYVLSYNSSQDSFNLKNPANQIMGTFKKLDNLRIGRFANQYLNGSSGNQNFTRPVKIVVEELPANRTPGTHHLIAVENLAQVKTKVNDSNYSSFLNNQVFGLTSSAPVVNYNNSAFLRGQYSWINAWNSSHLGSPTTGPAYVSIDVKEYNPDCSNSVEEIVVTRGKSGYKQIEDTHCGIRQINLTPDNTGNSGPVELFLKVNFLSSNVRKGMNFGVFTNTAQRLSNKLKIYIPETSQRINMPANPLEFWNGSNPISQLGSNICNTTVLNYSYDNWIGVNCSVAESISSTVVTKPFSSANFHKNYNGFGKIRIYDSIANLSNWNLQCSFNGIDVDLTLSNTVTGQIEHYLNFNDRSSGFGTGYCSQLLTDEAGIIVDPGYAVSVNLNDIFGAISPVNNIRSSAYESMMLEFVDTSSSSETPETFLGVLP